jgi:hypothetical protein
MLLSTVPLRGEIEMTVKHIRPTDPGPEYHPSGTSSHISRRDIGKPWTTRYMDILYTEWMQDDPTHPIVWCKPISCPKCYKIMGHASGQANSWANAQKEMAKVHGRYMEGGSYHKTTLHCPHCGYTSKGGNKTEYNAYD